MYNPFTLVGKTILVTGASSGIGKSIAIECSKFGAKLVITARNEDRLKETYSMLEGKEHISFVTDLSKDHEIELLVENCPGLDGLVNSAGISMLKPIKYITKDSVNEIFNINTFGPILLTTRFLKKKKLNTDSSIVFISSISGVIVSSIGESSYSATKGAINGFVKGAAIDLAPMKIRVNSVNPGIVNTSLLNLAEELFSDGQIQKKIDQYPLKRFGEPEEVAFGVIYLLSNASRWVTGINLVIDGGFTAQ